MTGLIWLVQLVHYPGFALVGESSFRDYEAFHVVRITYIVLPAMLLELLSGIALFVFASDRNWLIIANLVLLGVIWLSTAFIQVPLHSQLEAGFSQTTIASLVKTNWIRTIAWTIRSGLLVFLVWQFSANP